MSSHDYDAIVLGAGPAGEVCAGALSDGGLRVAIVEPELVGGECSYWACIPSKTLLRPGEAFAAAQEAPGAKEAVTGRIDAAAAFEWRDFMVSDHEDAGAAKWLEGKDIALYRGSGRLDGPGRVVVGDDTLTAKQIVLATGSAPVIPPVDGLRELEGIWTNREVTAMEEVPQRLLVLGGGPVGVEMSQAVARLGGEVVLIQPGAHVLPHEADQLGEALNDVLRDQGVELCLGVHAQAARGGPGAYELDLEDGRTVKGTHLLVATGRKPRIEGLGLETVGIEDAGHGVPVDERMQVSDGLWAIGDVTGKWPMTYVGKYQGRIAAANILGGDRKANYEAVPRVVFSDPQAVSVGEIDGPLSATVPLAEVARMSTYTRAYADRRDFLTIVSDGERVTGAYALGPEAGEWLQQATLAIRARVPLDVWRDTIQPFPIFSEVYVEALARLSST